MIKRFFGKKKDAEEEIRIPTLETMIVGDLVDYDLKTWQVSGYNTYDYDGDKTREWELKVLDEVYCLETGQDQGETWWTFTRSVGYGAIVPDPREALRQEQDPPETVSYDGGTYYAVESTTGLLFAGGEDGDGAEFICWTYEGADGALLVLAQWGENEFTAHHGSYVESYQFIDVLPGGQAEG